MDAFAEASNELLASRSLQRRTDTKFAIHRDGVAPLLETLKSTFAIVTSSGARAADYQTQYYDTDNLDFFREHLRGRRPRVKVRLRNYLDRDLSYVEVKRKTPSSVTIKAREARDVDALQMGARDRAFIGRHLVTKGALRPSIRTDFRRVTLVGMKHNERLTIDLGLDFISGDRREHVDPLAVVELKQPRFRARSPGYLALRARRARPVSFSKYCAGVALLTPCARRRQALKRVQLVLRGL